MRMKLFVLLILAVFASEKDENAENDQESREKMRNNDKNPIIVKIEEDEYVKVNKKSKYIGVSYNKNLSKWRVQRWSKNENKQVSNGYYDDEETAAHASDTLARKMMKNGKRAHKLNFLDDETEVYQEKDNSSKFIGVSYNKNESKWKVQRWCKYENRTVYNGYYADEETAAHASDTLARTLMENGEHGHKINFPDDHTEEFKTTTSKYIGVSYHKNKLKWSAQRWGKNENKTVSNGYYDDVETAAHASDTLARTLMDNGEQNHKLNFPDDYTEVHPEEKRFTSKFIGVSYNKNMSKWIVQRRSKDENKQFSNGYYNDQETAAHASDTLARKLMKNGERAHKLNFPDDYTEVHREKKKTVSKFIGVSYNKNKSKWEVQRWSKYENKKIYNGYYDDEETAAHASDTLAQKLMKNGEEEHKLNFPDNNTEVYSQQNQNKKRKRPEDLNLGHPQIN